MAVLSAAAGCHTSYDDWSAPASPAPSRSSPAAVDRSEGPVAVIRKGDSLYRISRRHAVPLRDLIVLNGLRAPYLIHPGQRLRLPAAKQHVVQRGDTALGVAQRYGVSMKSLVAANGIEPPYRIYPGQALRLPVSGKQTRAGRAGTRKTTSNAAKPRTTARSPRPARPAGRVKSRPPKAVALAPPPPRAGKRFLWPVEGPVAVGFGNRGRGLHNDGINIVARRGTGVRAAENGIVAYSGNAVRGFGNLVLIKHAGGWMTAYAHNDVLLVRAGQKVRRGETISRVGSTGSVSRPQLHFELRRGRKAVDPLRHLPRARRSLSALVPADPAPRRPGPPGPG